MSEIDPEIVAIEARAASADVDIAAALKEAGVAPTTWARWKKGAFDPRRATLRKIHQALDGLAGSAAA